jgi:hypothetical protein
MSRALDTSPSALLSHLDLLLAGLDPKAKKQLVCIAGRIFQSESLGKLCPEEPVLPTVVLAMIGIAKSNLKGIDSSNTKLFSSFWHYGSAPSIVFMDCFKSTSVFADCLGLSASEVGCAYVYALQMRTLKPDLTK